VDDDAVEAVVNKNQQARKQLCETFHENFKIFLASLSRKDVLAWFMPRTPNYTHFPFLLMGGRRACSVA
jgi:hypothetical protein